jgi:sulfite reductase (ferredoxin)
MSQAAAIQVERLKQQMNPWACLEEIRRFAREGWDSIPEEWQRTYFRWWGVYTQGDGQGVVGGKGGEGNRAPFFMVRIRVPNGLLTAAQARVVADLSERYARGTADITVRHNIQLHWIRIEDLPAVLEALHRCGLTTIAACGDDARNITGCPLAGLDDDEICDASPLVLEATRLLAGNPEFYNLPRKYKVCITGCRVWCSYPEINDVALTAIRRGDEVGFSLRIGGGLSTTPYFAQRVNAFVRWDQALPVVRAATEIFREAMPLRENRKRARLKFLFLQEQWTTDRFHEELERRLGFRLDPAVQEDPPEAVYRDHVGVHPQKQEGLYYVGASVLSGRISPRQLIVAARLAEEYGNGELRTTTTQNLVLVNVPQARAVMVARELDAAGLSTSAGSLARGILACTGSEFCKLAVTETKDFALWLVDNLEERLPGFNEHIKLNITGCPNSCAQHWIADLGLEGSKIKLDGRLADAYSFWVGGSVGKHQSFATAVGYRCLAEETPAAIERLLRVFLHRRHGGERLREFFRRHTREEIRSFLDSKAEPDRLLA